MSVADPTATVVFGGYTIPLADIEELHVHYGYTKEISSFRALLDNSDKKYSIGETNEILKAAAALISIGRGANVPDILKGRVEDRQFLVKPYSHLLEITGRCDGEKLFRRNVTKSYRDMKGEDIVIDILDNFAGLEHKRAGYEFVADTDTTYTRLEYDDTPAWDILQYIAKTADKAGVIGFQFYIAPDGVFEFWPIGQGTSSLDLTDKIESALFKDGISKIRNRIKIYGAKTKSFPLGPDSATESLTGWTANHGTLSLDAVTKRLGSYAIKCSVDSGGGRCDFYFSHLSLKHYSHLRFYIKALATLINGKIRLLAPDQSNYFEAAAPECLGTDFYKADYQLGRNAEIDKDNGVWTGVGAPSWLDLRGVWIYSQEYVAETSVWVDGEFGYENGSYVSFDSGTGLDYVEDIPSQNLWQLREFADTDEELASDNECLLRAYSLLANLKDPPMYLTISSSIIDYGATPVLPGRKIAVTLPNENVVGNFRISSVDYDFFSDPLRLDISMELGSERPRYADYIYAMKAKASKLTRLKGAFP